MTLRRLRRLRPKEEDAAAAAAPERPGPADVYRALAAAGGTLPRVRKGAGFRWASPSSSPEEHRRVVTLEKKAEETFGFEIQTYGLHHQDRNSVEMFTFVCRVHGGSPAEAAGLKAGDTITGGERAQCGGRPAPGDRGDHQELRQRAPARHALRDVRPEGRAGGPAAIPEGEGGHGLNGGVRGGLGPPPRVSSPPSASPQQTLYEKWGEYRSLMVQEQRLVRGVVAKDPSIYDTLESIRWCLQGEGGLPGGSPRTSACGSDDSLYQTCLFADALDGDKAGDKDRDSEGPAPPPPRPRPTLARSASLKCSGGPGAAGRLWARAGDAGEGAAAPRKGRHSSFRRRLLKFIPGLNRALEEEESHL
ncbi:unnamed protein product [Bubo scandiacus]